MNDATIAEDRLLGGAVRLLQLSTGHRAGTDAVLLAALAGVREGDRVVDLGAASGAVGLMVAVRVAVASVLFVERDPMLVELCRRNAELNGLHARIVAGDLLASKRPEGLEAGAADLVVTNPPFFDDATPASPDPARRRAHHMPAGGLARWLAIAADLLAHRGRLAMIYRADRLMLCLDALRGRFGSIEIVPIHPKAGRDAVRVVVRAVKNGRAALQLCPPLVLHESDGSFTAEASIFHAAP